MSEPRTAVIPGATPPFWTVRRSAWGMGGLAFLAVLLTIADPGITIDEPLDVAPGRKYVETLGSRGWRFFEPATVAFVYFDSREHPPLGRWLLGIASESFQWAELILAGKRTRWSLQSTCGLAESPRR